MSNITTKMIIVINKLDKHGAKRREIKLTCSDCLVKTSFLKLLFGVEGPF